MCKDLKMARARLTFYEKVVWTHKTFIAGPASVQGVPERTNWTLGFMPDISLNELCFEGKVVWLVEPKEDGLKTGVKFYFLNLTTGKPFAIGEIL